VTDSAVVETITPQRPKFLELLNASAATLDKEAGTCTLAFDISTDFCHSVNVIQGGFVTAMLDAAMAHAGFGLIEGVLNVATLEIKVSFFEPSLAGRYRAIGKLGKIGGSVGFMTAELFNEAGELTASASSTAKLVRAKKGLG